jgi:aminopeptidase N
MNYAFFDGKPIVCLPIIFSSILYISVAVKFDIPPETTWIKVNVNQSGFYRVTYSNDMWQSIISALQHNHTAFSPADRAGLIDDAFTLCRYVISLTKALKNRCCQASWLK